TCPSCGAHAPATAAWCGQCYGQLAPSTADPIAAPASGVGTPDRFGIVSSPAAAALATAPTAVPGSAVATLPPSPAGPPVGAPSWTQPAVPVQPAVPPQPARTGALSAWGWGSTGMTAIVGILLG